MPWQKPSPTLGPILKDALGDLDCQLKPMFGCPAWFVNGQMFTGVFEDKIQMCLSPEDRAEIIATWPGAGPFEPMAGRPMREYIAIPEAKLGDPARLRPWLERAHAYALSLPPKEAKPPKPRKAKG